MSNRRIRIMCLMVAILISIGIAFVSAPTPAIFAQTSQATSTPDPTVGLSISELMARSYGGGQVTADQVFSTTATFTRYIMHYPSDGLTIYGFMDVPTAAPRNGIAYPVIIATHGYIDPGIYQTLDYTTRYADALAAAGYLVLHPNLRNYAPSDSGPNLLRVGYAVDVLNLAAIVRAQGGQTGSLQKADPAEIGLWGHSMGGGVSIRAMTVDPLIKAVLLYAPISGNDKLDAARWHGRPGQYDTVISDDVFQRTSPIYFYNQIQAAVSIHQGLADTTVPPEWSADLCTRLQTLKKSVECFTSMRQV